MAASGWRCCVVVCLALILQACSHQNFNYAKYTERNDMQTYWLEGQNYRHWLVFKPGEPKNTLRVYISGDGSPWLLGRYVNDDPTPQNPIALRLMKLDPLPALYLGRPCYHAQEPPCGPSDWTDARYSAAVVDSMLAAMRRFLALSETRKLEIKRIELVGYSGGGALAVLLANRLDLVSKAVTIAGNLDHRAWTTRFSYLPLSQSLNPIADVRPTTIPMIHMVGSKDGNIKPEFIETYVKKHGGELIIMEGFDHSCCWLENWPGLLTRIDRLN